MSLFLSESILFHMCSLTLPITFQFELFFHSANTSINLNFDPRNINVTQVEQTFITLESRPASRRKSVVDSQVEGWAKWAMMNKTLYGDSKKTSAIREMFGNTVGTSVCRILHWTKNGIQEACREQRHDDLCRQSYHDQQEQ